MYVILFLLLSISLEQSSFYSVFRPESLGSWSAGYSLEDAKLIMLLNMRIFGKYHSLSEDFSVHSSDVILYR